MKQEKENYKAMKGDSFTEALLTETIRKEKTRSDLRESNS